MEIICSAKPRTSYFIPMTPKGDKHLISPYNITPELPAKATRIKEMITNLRSSLLTDKFLQPVPYKMYEKPALHTPIVTDSGLFRPVSSVPKICLISYECVHFRLGTLLSGHAVNDPRLRKQEYARKDLIIACKVGDPHANSLFTLICNFVNILLLMCNFL